MSFAESLARLKTRNQPQTVDADGAIVVGWPRTRSDQIALPSSCRSALARIPATAIDLAVIVSVATCVGIIHAWGMGRSPAFFDDEGAYVSQAWAVDKLHVLAPYTYWYDHPPLGWIMLGGWAKVVPTFGASLNAIAASRAFILVISIASFCFLYLIGRRIGLRRPFAAFAVLLFGLSPLALQYQRMVLLDNIAVAWLLAAFVMALSPSRRLWACAASGVCLACAVLTKETFLLFLPALLVAVWQQAPRETRRFAIGLFCAIFVMTTSFYPLFALLRGEFFPGLDHTSLIDGVRFQLTRRGSGSVFDPHSSARTLLESWLHIDAVVLTVGVLLIPLGLAVRRLRAVTLALVLPVAMLLRPGGYLPAMYVIALLPFAALLPAAVANWLFGLRARAIALGACTRFGRLRRRLLAASAVAVAVALVAAITAFAAPRWAPADLKQMREDQTVTSREAIAWLARHAKRGSRLLVDNTLWVDLVERGFKANRTIWFYKLDLDPAVRTAWWRFDYVVRSNLMAGNLFWLRTPGRVFNQSRLVVSFTNGDDRIEIRQVIRPRRPDTLITRSPRVQAR